MPLIEGEIEQEEKSSGPDAASGYDKENGPVMCRAVSEHTRSGRLQRRPVHQWQLKQVDLNVACTLYTPFACSVGLVIVSPIPLPGLLASG